MKAEGDSNNGESSNKSEAVRGVFAKNPKATSREVISTLAESGIKVTPTMVYYVRSKQKQANRKVKRALVAESSRKTGAKNPVEVVIRVKDLAREVGGMQHLKQLVDLLAE
ncbi:MAG: hypothetical protein C0467_02380 [Planctomycetaceae bacterium]|nr:hypothetical protein [Planctomycetaceae bacterium]